MSHNWNSCVGVIVLFLLFTMTSYDEMDKLECSDLNLPNHLMCEKCKHCIIDWSCGRPWLFRRGKRGRYGGVIQHPNFVPIWDHIGIDSNWKAPPGYYKERSKMDQHVNQNYQASLPSCVEVSEPAIVEPSPPPLH